MRKGSFNIVHYIAIIFIFGSPFFYRYVIFDKKVRANTVILRTFDWIDTPYIPVYVGNAVVMDANFNEIGKLRPNIRYDSLEKVIKDNNKTLRHPRLKISFSNRHWFEFKNDSIVFTNDHGYIYSSEIKNSEGSIGFTKYVIDLKKMLKNSN